MKPKGCGPTPHPPFPCGSVQVWWCCAKGPGSTIPRLNQEVTVDIWCRWDLSGRRECTEAAEKDGKFWWDLWWYSFSPMCTKVSFWCWCNNTYYPIINKDIGFGNILSITMVIIVIPQSSLLCGIFHYVALMCHTLWQSLHLYYSYRADTMPILLARPQKQRNTRIWCG